jgi:hypothetical protein
MKKKVLVIGGVASLGVIILIYLYYQSQRKIQAGIDYNLSPAGEIFNITGDTGATDESGERIPIDTRVEPARSLIAQQMEAFYMSPNTMTEIRQRIGFNSNLFRGINSQDAEKIKQAIALKFDINKNAFLSYPNWDFYTSPFLGSQLKTKGQANLLNFRTGSNALQNWATVPQWGLNFSNVGFDVTAPQGFSSLRQFFENAAAEIYRLDDAVRLEAVQYLRRQGWKFSDYGDVK